MRNYEGVVGLAETADPILRRNLFIIDRFLRQISAAGIPTGQPPTAGAGGPGGPPCCQNEVDEYEVVTDATEGVLSFGRVSDFADSVNLDDHVVTRLEGAELGGMVFLLGDATTGAVAVQSTTVHAGAYAIQITKGGAAAANFDLALFFDADGQPATTLPKVACSWRAWIRFSALPDATRTIFSLKSGASIRSNLQLTSGGLLVLDGVSGTTALVVDTWYELVGLYDSTSSGTHTIQLNRDPEVTATPASNGTVLSARFGSPDVAGTYTMFVDDICFESSDTPGDITYPPEGEIYGTTLTGDGALTASWGLVGAATNWEACNIPNDGATSSIGATNAGDRYQTFLHELNAGIRAPVNTVQFTNIVRADTAGNYHARVAIAPFNSSSAGDLTFLTTDTAIGPGSSSFQQVSSLEQLNPITSSQWTIEALESILLCAHVDPTPTTTARVTTVSMQIDVGAQIPFDYARAIRVTAAEGHVIPAYLVQDGDTFSATGDWARLVAGYDGTNVQVLLTDSSGRLMLGGPGTGATDLGKAEDSPHTSGDVGVMALAVRDDDPPTATAALGDYTPLLTDSTGRLWVNTELPDAAALGDADANPTTPRIGADLQAWNGASWYRAGGSAAAGLEVNVLKLPTAAALGDTDANPTTTKVGAAVMFVNEGTKTGTPTWNRNTGETHATDEAGNTDDAGLHVSEIHKSFTVTLDNVSTAYDTNPETQTSTGQSTRRFRYAVLTFTLDSTGTPTDIVFDVEMSPDNSNWYKPGSGFLQDLRYDDTVCATAINESIPIDKLDRFVRLVVTATGGTGAGTKFDVTNAKITFFN